MPALKKKEKEQKIVMVLFFVDPIVRFLENSSWRKVIFLLSLANKMKRLIIFIWW